MNTEYNKALVAAVMAVLGLVQWYTEFNLSFISSDGVMAIIAALTPALVWVVPNKAKPAEAAPAPVAPAA